MRGKVLIAVILGVIVVILVILTVSNPNEQENNPFTFSVLYNESQDKPFNEDWAILDEYEKQKNVKLDIRIGDDQNYEEAIDLNINAVSPPDVILKCWPETIEKYVSDGLILPISDYIDLMPNYKSYIEDNGLHDEVDKLRMTNGKYYLLPGYKRKLQVQQWIYRKDVFESNNISMPTTYDELYDSLVTLKEMYPETTPITASWGGAHLLSMMGAGYGIPAGWSGTQFYDEGDNEWKYAPATENYRELYRFLNKSYSAGILDPAFFTQSNAEFTEKIVNGKALVTVTWISSGFATWNEQLNENGIPEGEWAPLPVMESTVGISALPPVNRFRVGLAISANAVKKDYFEDMIKFLDWAIYSDQGIELTYWGVEGLTYKTKSDGKEFLSDIVFPNNPDGTTRLSNYGFNTLFNLNEDEEFEDNKRPEEIVTFLKNSVEANDTLNSAPLLILDNTAIDMIGFIREDLTPYVQDASNKFITGELSIEKDWDNYIDSIDELGYTILEIIWNDAWENQIE